MSPCASLPMHPRFMMDAWAIIFSSDYDGCLRYYDLVQVHCCVAMMNWQGIGLIAEH